MITSTEFDDRYKQLVTQRFHEGFLRLYQGHLISQRLTENDHNSIESPIVTLEQRNEIKNRLQLARKLSETLVGGEVPIHPQIAVALETLNSELVAKYGFQNFAIILMGSHATGAYAVRQLFETQDQSDIDWGIVCDRSAITSQMVDQIIAYANNFFDHQQYFLNHTLRMCAVVNPREFLHDNLSSASDLAEYILILADKQKIMDNWCFDLINYFCPSFPAEVNQRNAQIILDALKLVYRKNFRAWEFITDKLLEIHSLKYSLKAKHLSSKDNRIKSKYRRNEVSQISQQALAFSFEDKLRATTTV